MVQGPAAFRSSLGILSHRTNGVNSRIQRPNWRRKSGISAEVSRFLCFYHVLNSLCMLDVMNAIRNMHTLDTNHLFPQQDDGQVASAWSPELKYSKIMFWISFLSWSCSSHCGQGPLPTNLYSSMAYHLSVRGFIEMKFIIYIYVYVYVYVYNIHNIHLPIHSYTYAVTYIHTLIH